MCSDHAVSRWIRKISKLTLASLFQFQPVAAACYMTFFFPVAISKIKWKLRGQVVMIRSYSNSYSAIHTPKGTRVQQEIRTTHMKRNNSNYWQWFS